MSEYDYDLFVIGGGSGGVRASRFAAATGARVAIAEEYRMGGTCVIRGCVPKKLLSYASHGFEDVELLEGYGFDARVSSFDWATLIANKDKEIDRLERIYDGLMSGAGVELYKARAVVVDPHTVEVAGKRVTAERILVAVGGRPTVPPIPGCEHTITSNEVFHLAEQPKRVAVIGGGYIAVEFAGIFNGLGSETHLVVRSEVLRGFDDDIRHHLHGEMEKKGINCHIGAVPAGFVKNDDGSITVQLSDGSAIDVDCVMMAAGRRPNTDDLGLKEVGVELNPAGAVVVDAYSQTNIPSIWAIGDVTDRMQLTPVALHEAMCFVDTVYRGTPRAMDYDNIASAVFSNPQIGTVGLTEAQAREQFDQVEIYRSDFRPMKYILPDAAERCLMKLVVDKASDRVVGLHVCGLDAAEMTQGFAVAMKAGATKAMFDATVGIHPTAAEELVTMREPVKS